MVDRAVEQALTPETLTHAFGAVLQNMFSAFRESHGLHDGILRDNVPAVTPQQHSIRHTALRQMYGSPDDSSFGPFVDEQNDSSAPDMQYLASFISQAPSHDLELDFENFLKPLEEY
ncbi:hypothetical protein G7Z17_g6441 [Cylindrodendrum hubeiense]|uniref:Uncharacterized protein n=1 Tax=Cylindrodendrum hubeiense TaxID=595255 RepID=A0A9P5L885_9HYPO|nr:hypothetical protein G7Z17_g6441 [Cylindrodendrum hubeiense]